MKVTGLIKKILAGILVLVLFSIAQIAYLCWIEPNIGLPDYKFSSKCSWILTPWLFFHGHHPYFALVGFCLTSVFYGSVFFFAVSRVRGMLAKSRNKQPTTWKKHISQSSLHCSRGIPVTQFLHLRSLRWSESWGVSRRRRKNPDLRFMRLEDPLNLTSARAISLQGLRPFSSLLQWGAFALSQLIFSLHPRKRADVSDCPKIAIITSISKAFERKAKDKHNF